jgi:hypothetical protein
MAAINLHPIGLIEPVGVLSLHSRIEGHDSATFLFCIIRKPFQQVAAKSARTKRAVCYQIVHVKVSPIKQTFGNTNACKTGEAALIFKENQFITIFLLPANLREELVLRNVRPQLRGQRKAVQDFRIGLGNCDGGQARTRISLLIFSSNRRRHQFVDPAGKASGCA